MALSSSSSSTANLLVLLLILFTTLFTNSFSQSFKCAKPENSTCKAIVDYKTPNTTTLSSIKKLFSVKHLNSILGANHFNLSTPQNQTVLSEAVIKIPFDCICRNGTGISNKNPTYIVQPGDGLDHIARDVFSELVTLQQIADVNGIPDPNKIDVGQELWIPLPCSCDEVGGESVVHYGYLVKSGNTLQQIANDYGSSVDVLTSLNGGVNDSSLKAGQVLDVPLRACNSSVSPSSLDYPLLVPNGTYTVTANSCVKCSCDSANSWILQCEPSGLTLTNSTWSTCRFMQCNSTDNLSLGNSTTAGCNTTTCAYSGYSKQEILTTLATLSTCPANTPTNTTGPDNYASSTGLSWKFLLVSLTLCVYHL